MRSLTRAQATVLLSLLGSGNESERQRELASGLARTTYQDAKRRLYAEGCLEDRYLPHPALLGVRDVRFRIARPFADAIAEVARSWASDPEAVLVWQGSQSVFGVFFERPRGRPPHGPGADHGAAAAPREVSLRVEAHTFSLPVYFDFEGALSRFTGVWVPRGYPRSFGGPFTGGHVKRLPWGFQRHPEVLATLVRRPFEAPEHGRPGHLIGPTSLPRSQRQLLALGVVDWRVMLNVERLPPFRGRRVRDIALVHGALRPGVRPTDLFHALVRRVGSHPFLFATDATHVLFGSLLVPPPTGSSAGPEADAGPVEPLEVLRSSLSEIDVAREPLESLQVVVNHRYDRLLGPSAKSTTRR